MHSLVELWALLALFLSKIFDQVGCGEWSADVGLFNFGGREQGLEDWCLLAPPPPPPPPPRPPLYRRLRPSPPPLHRNLHLLHRHPPSSTATSLLHRHMHPPSTTTSSPPPPPHQPPPPPPPPLLHSHLPLHLPPSNNNDGWANLHKRWIKESNKHQ